MRKYFSLLITSVFEGDFRESILVHEPIKRNQNFAEHFTLSRSRNCFDDCIQINLKVTKYPPFRG